MFFAVLRMECDKVFKRKLPWIGMIIVLSVFLLYFTILFEGMRQRVGGLAAIFPWPAGILSGSFMVVSSLPIASMGIFLALIVAAGSTAQEYGWHSLQLWLSQGVSRPALFFAKVIVCFLTVLLITIGALLAGVITSIIAALQLHLSIDVMRLNVLQFFIAWLRLSYSILPYTMFAFMLAILFRSTIPAVSIGLFFAALVEMFMLPLSRYNLTAKHIWSFMPLSLAHSLDQLNFAAAGYSTPPSGFYGPIPLTNPVLAAVAITLYIVVFVGIAYGVFLRQNMNG